VLCNPELSFVDPNIGKSENRPERLDLPELPSHGEPGKRGGKGKRSIGKGFGLGGTCPQREQPQLQDFLSKTGLLALMGNPGK
jgi:hypothetical protein